MTTYQKKGKEKRSPKEQRKKHKEKKTKVGLNNSNSMTLQSLAKWSIVLANRV
jgi:hypothetical protein